MDPQVGRAGFRISFYVMFVSGIMLFFIRPGSAEFVVTSLALLAGLFFATAIGVLAYLANRTGDPRVAPPSTQRDDDDGEGLGSQPFVGRG